tara:strand:+ start:270 stop:455 length:186 start_codon:yes stop_codon:yes gene_type:complete|eukprot:scaffold100385_cov64-Phaeocystis_antarctica.AAC.5
MGDVVKTEKAKYITRYDTSRFAALLDANRKDLDSFSSLAIDYMQGATRIRSNGGTSHAARD